MTAAEAERPDDSRARPVEAVVFDMDGVLFDSEPLHLLTLNDVLREEGVTLSEAANLEFLGTPVEEIFRSLIASEGLSRTVDDYMGRYDEAIVQIFRERLEPAPGVPGIFEMLRSLELRLGLASSSRRLWIEAALMALDLSRYFEVVVSAEDVERGKPDPGVYLLAAARLGVEPSRIIAIEDAPAGVLAAKRAGMTVYGVRTEYTKALRLDQADRVVDSLSELAPADFVPATSSASPGRRGEPGSP